MNLTSTVGFPEACKKWRQFRKLSQLDLAFEADISQRHLSYLETGRSQPSKDMVLRLADAMDVPLRERNALLQAAGFKGVYQESQLNSPQMSPVLDAVNRVLAHHDPYPAILVDRFWNVTKANQAATHLFGHALAAAGLPPKQSINIAELTLHPNGMRQFIVNWSEILPSFVKRLRSEAMASGDPAVVEKLTTYLQLVEPELNGKEISVGLLPVMPLVLNINGMVLSFFSVMSTFGTPQDITTDELRIETFYPTDQQTTDYFSSLF